MCYLQQDLPQLAFNRLYDTERAVTLPGIHTIGYEGATIEDLIATLKGAGVTRVIDIRSSPYSRRPEFSKDELAVALSLYEIAYEHIRQLGNPPAGREAVRAGHMAAYREIFDAHLNSADGRKGLQQALALAAQETVCLLCLEKSASHCHRMMVADRMSASSGFEVVHLKVAAKQAHPGQASFSF
jgi:uncharacterized protein (DUF488 family)